MRSSSEFSTHRGIYPIHHRHPVCFNLDLKLNKEVISIEIYYRHEKRFEAVLMRARFDATRECKDMRKCAAMLEVAEDMLFECQHLYPFKYKFDEGGIMFARVHNFPDYLHDIWHPWEVVSITFLNELKANSRRIFFLIWPNLWHI